MMFNVNCLRTIGGIWSKPEEDLSGNFLKMQHPFLCLWKHAISVSTVDLSLDEVGIKVNLGELIVS